MRRLVLVHRPGVPDPERREVAGPCSAGGSRGDAVMLDGVAPGALRLEPCAAGLLVEAASAGVRAAGHALLPGARRLLRAGERVVVRGNALALPVEEAPAGAQVGSTRVIASGLLRRTADRAGAPPGPHLLVLTGPDAGQRLPLGPEQTLGRSRRATLRLADPRASRLHARLRVDDAGATVEDLGARNGLRVNGVPIEARAQPLLAGDVLGVGETELALIVPWAAGVREASPPAPELAAATEAAPRGSDLRRTAAALLALAALALALAGA